MKWFLASLTLCIIHYDYSVAQPDNIEVVDSASFYQQLNNQAIDHFFSSRFAEALEKFNQVLNDYNYGKVDEINCGTALFGKALCSGAMEKMHEFFKDVEDLRHFFFEVHGCKHIELTSNANLGKKLVVLTNTHWFDRPKGQHAPDPHFELGADETISIGDCIDRVETTIRILKGAVSILKRGEVKWLLNEFLDEFQSGCVNCCRTGAFWSKCVHPVVMKWKKWNIFGVPDDPAWD